MANTVWQYELRDLNQNRTQAITMPSGYRLLGAKSRGLSLLVWAQVDPDQAREDVTFSLLDNNESVEDGYDYFTTVDVPGGIRHIYCKRA